MVSKGIKAVIIMIVVVVVGVGIATALAGASAKNNAQRIMALDENWNKRIATCYQSIGDSEPGDFCDSMRTDMGIDCQTYDYLLEVCHNGKVEQYYRDRGQALNS